MSLFIKRSVVLMFLMSVCLFSCKKEPAKPEVDDSLLLGEAGTSGIQMPCHSTRWTMEPDLWTGIWAREAIILQTSPLPMA